MLRKLGSSMLLVAVVALGAADAAYAQRQTQRQPAGFRVSRSDTRQTLNFTFGRFFPLNVDKRLTDDVLVQDQLFPQYLDFSIDQFRSPTFGIEWLFPVGNHIEMGPSFSYMKRTVRTTYTYLFDQNQDEIVQDLSWRVIPLAFTARVLPLPPSAPVQPYVGGGFGLFNWRYREEGSFVDFNDDPGGDCTDLTDNCRVFTPDPPDFFTGTGHDFAPIFLFGARVQGDAFGVGAEFRYQWVEGDLPTDNFFGSKLDLKGWTFQGTLGVRF